MKSSLHTLQALVFGLVLFCVTPVAQAKTKACCVPDAGLPTELVSVATIECEASEASTRSRDACRNSVTQRTDNKGVLHTLSCHWACNDKIGSFDYQSRPKTAAKNSKKKTAVTQPR